MIARCTQPSNPAFAHYQKRGIGVCARWRRFDHFLEDMGLRPSPSHTIERVDNNQGYAPENCRWATKVEQGNNRVTNVHFEFEGKRYTLAELARHTGTGKEILRSRLRRSKLPWTVEGAVKTPLLPKTMTKAGFYC